MQRESNIIQVASNSQITIQPWKQQRYQFIQLSIIFLYLIFYIVMLYILYFWENGRNNYFQFQIDLYQSNYILGMVVIFINGVVLTYLGIDLFVNDFFVVSLIKPRIILIPFIMAFKIAARFSAFFTFSRKPLREFNLTALNSNSYFISFYLVIKQNPLIGTLLIQHLFVPNFIKFPTLGTIKPIFKMYFSGVLIGAFCQAVFFIICAQQLQGLQEYYETGDFLQYLTVYEKIFLIALFIIDIIWIFSLWINSHYNCHFSSIQQILKEVENLQIQIKDDLQD